MAVSPPAKPSDKWQKHYYRGVDVHGDARIRDHQAKVKVKPFTGGPDAPPPQATKPLCPMAVDPTLVAAQLRVRQLERSLAQRDRLLDVIEGQRLASPAACVIPHRQGITRQLFQDEHYALSRPVVIGDMLADWPALGWTPAVLKAKVGDVEIEYRGQPGSDTGTEQDLAAQTGRGRLARFIDDVIAPVPGSSRYVTTDETARNAAALAPLAADLRTLDFLGSTGTPTRGTSWIGGAGAFTPLHQVATNTLIAQLVGRQRVRLAPPSETGRLYDDEHRRSVTRDLDAALLDVARFPRLVDVHLYDMVLHPGKLLFVPVGWWCQRRALDFAATWSYTDFPWSTRPADPEVGTSR